MKQGQKSQEMLALETRLRKFKGEARMSRDELVSAKQAGVLLPNLPP